MIRLKEIQDAMLHLVGWEQSYDPEREIDKTLVESESGLLFQQAHSLMTLDNIENTIPENFMLQYPEWNQIKTYAQGTKVRHKGVVWIANYDSTGIEPEATDFNQDFNNDFGSELAGAWVKYNFLSDYLERLTRSGIAKAIQTFLQTKQLNRETKDLFDRKTFFDGAARLQATIRASHKLVGIELVPVRAMGVTLKIHKIGFQAVGATGTVKFYLFHSSQKDPVKTFEVNFTNTSGGFQWFSFEDLFLPYISDGTDAGGAWFLCYYQDELPFGMEALNVSKDWSREPCGTCNIGSVEVWREMTKYLQASPFCVIPPEDFSENPQMWDIAQTMYTNTMNYGINYGVAPNVGEGGVGRMLKDEFERAEIGPAPVRMIVSDKGYLVVVEHFIRKFLELMIHKSSKYRKHGPRFGIADFGTTTIGEFFQRRSRRELILFAVIFAGYGQCLCHRYYLL